MKTLLRLYFLLLSLLTVIIFLLEICFLGFVLEWIICGEVFVLGFKTSDYAEKILRKT